METYYSPKEVSEKLKLNIRTIYKWIKEGRLQAVKLGDVWRISQSEINRLLGKK
ncbi:MAG TPA: helix-turn-helix domain-containing protein [Corynebacteriales bacterium]|nr:helix-turn-helix domain-containing protein [Mycobacteriales bacterium]